MKTILYFWSFILIQLISHKINVYAINQCAQQIHQGCTNSYVPTDAEVENARIYIQQKFLQEADYPPTTQPCPKLYVRRNFKCMTHEERLRVIAVLQQLYANGFMWELAEIHSKCWSPWHKSMEAITSHRWLQNKLERAMIAIDPGITLPYWKTNEDCVNPHESLIWRYFGTSGTNASDWCLTDGPFTQQTQERCIRRQWNVDGTIPNWYCPDLINIGLHLGSFFPLLLFFALGLHFHEHLNTGGLNGHYSQTWAPYDFVFYMHHTYYTDCLLANWQLSSRSHLTPKSYNVGWRFDLSSRRSVKANIGNDTLCHYNIPLIETWQLGFGEMCFICDQVVQAINKQLGYSNNNNIDQDVKQFLERFPKQLHSKLLPLMSKWNALQTNELQTPDPSICNPKCYPQPLPPSYTSDVNGRRQLIAIRDDWNLNLLVPMLLSDTILNAMVKLFNRFGYCSAYVTSVTGYINTTASGYQLAKRNMPKISRLESMVYYLKYIIEHIS